MQFFKFVGDDEAGNVCFLVQPLEVEHDIRDVALKFHAHLLLGSELELRLVEFQLQFLLLLAGKVVHVVGDGFDAAVDLELESEVLLLEGDDGVLKHGYLVAEVDLFVVEFFDGDAAVDGRLGALYFLLEVLVVGVGGQRVLVPGGVALEVVDLVVHLADEFPDGLVGDRVQFLADVLGIDLAHHLVDEVLGLLHLLLAVVHLPSLLLFLLFSHLVDVLELLVELLALLLARHQPHVPLHLLLLLLHHLPGLRGEDAQRFLVRGGLLGTGLVVANFLPFFGDGEKRRQLLFVLKVHPVLLCLSSKVVGEIKSLFSRMSKVVDIMRKGWS